MKHWEIAPQKQEKWKKIEVKKILGEEKKFEWKKKIPRKWELLDNGSSCPRMDRHTLQRETMRIDLQKFCHKRGVFLWKACEFGELHGVGSPSVQQRTRRVKAGLWVYFSLFRCHAKTIRGTWCQTYTPMIFWPDAHAFRKDLLGLWSRAHANMPKATLKVRVFMTLTMILLCRI